MLLCNLDTFLIFFFFFLLLFLVSFSCCFILPESFGTVRGIEGAGALTPWIGEHTPQLKLECFTLLQMSWWLQLKQRRQATGQCRCRLFSGSGGSAAFLLLLPYSAGPSSISPTNWIGGTLLCEAEALSGHPALHSAMAWTGVPSSEVAAVISAPSCPLSSLRFLPLLLQQLRCCYGGVAPSMYCVTSMWRRCQLWHFSCLGSVRAVLAVWAGGWERVGTKQSVSR